MCFFHCMGLGVLWGLCSEMEMETPLETEPFDQRNPPAAAAAPRRSCLRRDPPAAKASAAPGAEALCSAGMF